MIINTTRKRRTGLGSGTRSVDAVLIGARLVVDVHGIQRARVVVQPARVVVEVEVDRHAGRFVDAQLLTRAQRRDAALYNAVD